MSLTLYSVIYQHNFCLIATFKISENGFEEGVFPLAKVAIYILRAMLWHLHPWCLVSGHNLCQHGRLVDGQFLPNLSIYVIYLFLGYLIYGKYKYLIKGKIDSNFLFPFLITKT